MDHLPGASRRAAAVLALVVGPLAACVAGPFERANPNDAEFEITLTIVGGADTLRGGVGTGVLFQLVTDPVTNGAAVGWSASAPALLSSQGHGQFTVESLPASPTSVIVTAQLGAHAASRAVVIMPPP